MEIFPSPTGAPLLGRLPWSEFYFGILLLFITNGAEVYFRAAG